MFSSSFKTPRMRITKRPAPVVLCLLMCTYRAHTIKLEYKRGITRRIYRSSRVRQLKPNIIGGAQGRVRLQQYHNLALATASPAEQFLLLLLLAEGAPQCSVPASCTLLSSKKKSNMNLSSIPGEFVPMVGSLPPFSRNIKKFLLFFVHHLLRHL